jgi:adenylate cyclase, class 2
MLEREVKLSFSTPDEARAAVLAAGAAPLRSRRLQEDALFDTDDESLRRRRCVLRVRSDAGKSVLTFKGPVHPGSMKTRDEHETIISDGEVLKQVFGELGLHEWFRYQKYREEYAAPDVTIAIDETPVGTFVELEGDEASIILMTRALGRTPDDFILDSYRSLFIKHREAAGLIVQNMVFDEE